MKNVKQWAGLFLFPVIAAVLTVYILLQEPAGSGISRALAARAVTLAVCSEEEFAAWRGENWASHFPADLQEEWYAAYMDYMYAKGYFSSERIPADRTCAEQEMTWEDVRQLAAAVDEGLADKVRVTQKNREAPMPEEDWWRFYDRLLSQTGAEQAVAQTELVLYGTPANIPGAAAWTAYTDQGEWDFSGLALDSLMDQRLTVLVRDRSILRVVSVSPEVVYENVWITAGDEEGLSVCIGELEKKLPFGRKVKSIGTLLQNVADLHLSEGKITKVTLKKDRIQAKLLSVRENALELEGYGLLELAPNCPFMKIYGQAEQKSLSDLTVGAQNLEYVVADGKIAAVLAVRDEEEELIRVLIMTTGFADTCHEQILLSCDAPLTLTAGGNEEELAAGQPLVLVQNDARLSSGRLVITPPEGHEITVDSIDRADGKPSYGGRLEVVQGETGLVLINELYFEDYLKKVVPSEMPGSFEPEALKAQAICARTYAWTQMHGNRYPQYGAQLDDSTSFQVYNNVETEDTASQAVQDTYGKLITYNGEPISAYYFSTSCGNTTDGSVWEMDPEDAPYLKSVALQPGRKTFGWSNEEEFSAFIRRKNVTAYDSDSAYFRWSMTTTADRLSETFSDVGTVKSLRISKRGAGGVALEMTVRGTDGEMTVAGQNSIRAALCDPSLSLTRNDGKTVSGFTMLPSAFLVVEPDGRTEDGVQKFTIYGGGNGHGAGMSQNGAQGMAKAGMSCEEILKFFFEGIEITDCAGKKTAEATETAVPPDGQNAQTTAASPTGESADGASAETSGSGSSASAEASASVSETAGKDRAALRSGRKP